MEKVKQKTALSNLKKILLTSVRVKTYIKPK